jgi:2-hydroxy-3-oxopropionate reductase
MNADGTPGRTMAGDASPATGTVGLVGLGQMGGAMCRTLLRAGWHVVVWDISAAAVAAAAEAGAEAATSPSEVATRGHLVITSLPDAHAVRAVALGPAGLVASRTGDLLVVDTSTTSPTEARDLAADLATYGVGFLDAPVSGGVRGAETGQLSVMVGGSSDLLDRVRPVLSLLAKAVIPCGPVGAGQITKACNQLVVMATHESIAEALLLAEASGLDAWRVRDALMAGYAASPILEIQGPRMLERDFVPGGKARFHLKDIATINELARHAGLELPAYAATARQVERLVEAGGGDLDNSALITLLSPDLAKPPDVGDG